MKRIGHMIYPRIKSTKLPKYYTCCKCGEKLTPDKAYFYVDESNYAITQNSKPYCMNCMKKRYG